MTSFPVDQVQEPIPTDATDIAGVAPTPAPLPASPGDRSNSPESRVGLHNHLADLTCRDVGTVSGDDPDPRAGKRETDRLQPESPLGSCNSRGNPEAFTSAATTCPRAEKHLHGLLDETEDDAPKCVGSLRCRLRVNRRFGRANRGKTSSTSCR